MNIQSIIILLVVAICIVCAIAVHRKNGSKCSCGGDCDKCISDCKKE